jgi:hypothetical protein
MRDFTGAWYSFHQDDTASRPGYLLTKINATTMADELTKGQPTSQTAQEDKAHKDYVIWILGIKNNGDLELSDGGETIANSDDTITWDIDAKSGVEEILELPRKDNPGNDDVFKDRPAKEQGSKKWKGKLKRVTDTKKEYYSIRYKKDDGQEATFDPVIQLNP